MAKSFQPGADYSTRRVLSPAQFPTFRTLRRYCLGRLCFGFLLSACLCGNASAAEGWLAFRGTGGQGHAERGARPPVELNAETRVWKTFIPGTGWSSPVVEGRQVWLTTSLSRGRSLRVICVDVVSGEILHDIELFRVPDPERIHDDNSYASPTPVLDDETVCVTFGTFGSAGIDRASGRVLWKREDLKIEHQGGPGSSPTQFENLLIMNFDGADHQYVIAVEKRTGETVWRRKRSAPFRPNPITHRAFSSPVVIPTEKGSRLISVGADQVHAYEPASGEEIWHSTFEGFSNVPAPILFDDLVIVSTGFFDPQLHAIRLGGEADVTKTHVVWKYRRQASTIPTPLVVGDRLYHINEKGILTCLKAASGEELWKQRVGGKFSASPIQAGGMIYLCGEDGRVLVIEPADEYQLRKVNRIEHRIKATPAVVGDSIFVRTERELLRFDGQTE